MKIGIIADTHISEKTETIPQEVLRAFETVDMIIHAGDLISLNVMKQLKNICPEVKAVYGNMDPREVRVALAEKEIIKINNFKIGVTHGKGSPNQLIEFTTRVFKADNLDVIIFGHSHSALNLKKGNILYFNPGSPTDKKFALYNSYGIITLGDTIEGEIIKING
ncbi:metallophosphoesterase [bacterium]|nr:MAG: metallophosphoesterase [bacterium]